MPSRNLRRKISEGSQYLRIFSAALLIINFIVKSVGAKIDFKTSVFPNSDHIHVDENTGQAIYQVQNGEVSF